MLLLLVGLAHTAAPEAAAQNVDQKTQNDTTIQQRRQPPKARARRQRQQPNDSTANDSARVLKPVHLKSLDSLTTTKIQIADSVDAANRRELQQLEAPVALTAGSDSLPPPVELRRRMFVPNSNKATWLAVIFPGGGQIYNRKYWKLPIIYGGFAGCAYALSWNGKMYNDYSQAYLDIMDSNPNTKSYEDLLPPNAQYTGDQLERLKDTIRRRKDMFRRYRDLSIFSFIAVYAVSIIDAYVDAELANFDISPDLSMKLEPAVIDNQGYSTRRKSVGLQCVLKF